MAASNYNQDTPSIILDLVAAANSGFDAVRSNFTLKLDNNTFITSPPNGSAKNTGVVVTPSPEGAATYEGDVAVGYNRLTIAAYVDGVTTDKTFDYTPDGTSAKPYLSASSSNADILLVLGVVLGIKFQGSALADFDSSLYALNEVTAGAKYEITLSPAATSLLFTGTTETITIEQPVQKQQTSSVVQNTELDGLDAPSNGG